MQRASVAAGVPQPKATTAPLARAMRCRHANVPRRKLSRQANALDQDQVDLRALAEQASAMTLHALRGGTSEYLYVDVRDQGTGIPASRMPHQFDTFFTTKKGGSGLGLSVSYRIASEHGGWIAVESLPGKGSCFTHFLPPAPTTPPSDRD